jgi:hypothetical protein
MQQLHTHNAAYWYTIGATVVYSAFATICSAQRVFAHAKHRAQWITHKSIQSEHHNAVGSRVVPQKAAQQHCGPETTAVYLQRVEHIARGLAHFPALCVSYQAVQVYRVKGHLVCDSKSGTVHISLGVVEGIGHDNSVLV